MDARGDFLVIGSGIAGLRAALSLAEIGTVVILTKADPRESNTGYAQGGIAAAIAADDSPELHARDATGREIARLLWSRVSGRPAIGVIDGATATDLILSGGRCRGAAFMTGESRGTATARHTLLATGGAGCVFRETTNPAIATGDGIALAARRGADCRPRVRAVSSNRHERGGGAAVSPFRGAPRRRCASDQRIG